LGFDIAHWKWIPKEKGKLKGKVSRMDVLTLHIGNGYQKRRES
jgi:hypothetical protein